MLAEEFCKTQHKSQYIMENIHEFIFGYHNKLEEVRNMIAKEGEEKLPAGLALQTELNQNMRTIQTYNLIKNAIWNSVLDDSSVKKSEQMVSLVLLRDVLDDIKIQIDAVEMSARYQIRLNQEGRSSFKIGSSESHQIHISRRA